VLLGLVAGVAQATIGNARDPSTYGNIDEAYSTHIDLDFAVDFDREVFEGQVVHTMKMVEPHVTSVFFDAEGLNVSKAEFILNHGGSGEYQTVEFTVTRPNDKLGDAIEVTLPYEHALPPGVEFRIRMTYVTNNRTTAISWLKPS
jgi:aminopeptidase N